ncbi:Smad nuclear-interacting protein 1 [Trypanosoma rangeli]|uniref:Smad nuclear-interacting protein 1 n=1 Tax=Trypanosoma rangeli TaxID=5698 RepID=A0A422N067_TRYRA|nr:Smad nuclear-interacting protein 1 [Trypanosoma rangeli]RNE98850.1 Smad nuclear-interacting protein 1 [Trypanosoma rangeli]|eukprot:RNE98850.1 Smad nuclear-interacting protein 1 [Trypanosoma rangeli]
MERPFYGRTGALDDVRQGLPVMASRLSVGRSLKWFPSLLTVPQRVLHSITEGDGVDHSILHLLRVACVYEELRRRHTDGTRHGALLHDVLKWHQLSLGEGDNCPSANAADEMFQPYLPAYNICVLKDGQPVATHAAVSRRAVTLLGKDRDVNDIPTDHPSCSAQHAALEVRFVYAYAEELDQQTTAYMEGRKMDWGLTQDIGELYAHVRETMAKLGDGADAWSVELQVLDLGSTNGTRLNGERLQPFVSTTLIEGDILTFGLSTRSYVVVRP